VLVGIAVAVSVLRSRVPEAATEEIAEPAAEAIEVPPIRVRPLPASEVPGGGCVETGTRVAIGCGGCAGTMP
jgi:hypothetical protein